MKLCDDCKDRYRQMVDTYKLIREKQNTSDEELKGYKHIQINELATWYNHLSEGNKKCICNKGGK